MTEVHNFVTTINDKVIMSHSKDKTEYDDEDNLPLSRLIEEDNVPLSKLIVSDFISFFILKA